MLFRSIEDHVANLIIAQLLFLESEDPEKDISLYINSPGGVVTAGLAIYDTMQYVRAPVSTICIGMAASMAAVLLSAGAKGKRYALSNSRIMIHQGSGGFRGNAPDAFIQMKEWEKLVQINHEILARHTGQKVEQVTKDAERDKYFSAEEAKASQAKSRQGFQAFGGYAVEIVKGKEAGGDAVSDGFQALIEARYDAEIGRAHV